MTIISPSLLSANLGALDRDMEMLNRSEADMLHVDVMDGVFVPNISFGFPVMKYMRKLTDKPLDVHLMIVDPDRYVGQVRDCGSDIMTVHQEACTHLHRVVSHIHEAGMKAGVSLNPATPVCMLEDVITDVDLVLIMSVNPGFGGQSFIPGAVEKVARLRSLIDRTGSKAKIEVDGGINLETGADVVRAGADILVSGNYIFKSADPFETIAGLRRL